MIRFAFFLALLMPFLCHAEFKYQLSIVAIFQDEAPYLKEWIEYHRLLGVDHFYLYNNSSSDNYLEVLNPYLNAKIVELKNWPSPRDKDWTDYQIAAYNDCIEKCRKKTNWLAMLDIDEYIVPRETDSLKEFLKPYETMHGVAGVVINWQMFGTSDVWEVSKNKLMIECLTQKAIKTCGHNQNPKSIIKPRHCKGNAIHVGFFNKGWKDRRPLNCGEWPHINTIQINHYWLRNEKFLREVKAPRRARYEGVVWTEEQIQAYINEMNAEEDLLIQRFVPALKMRMGL